VKKLSQIIKYPFLSTKKLIAGMKKNLALDDSEILWREKIVNYFKDFYSKNYYGKPHIILTGGRRSGKSTCLKIMAEELITQSIRNGKRTFVYYIDYEAFFVNSPSDSIGMSDFLNKISLHLNQCFMNYGIETDVKCEWDNFLPFIKGEHTHPLLEKYGFDHIIYVMDNIEYVSYMIDEKFNFNKIWRFCFDIFNIKDTQIICTGSDIFPMYLSLKETKSNPISATKYSRYLCINFIKEKDFYDHFKLEDESIGDIKKHIEERLGGYPGYIIKYFKDQTEKNKEIKEEKLVSYITEGMDEEMENVKRLLRLNFNHMKSESEDLIKLYINDLEYLTKNQKFPYIFGIEILHFITFTSMGILSLENEETMLKFKCDILYLALKNFGRSIIS